MRNSGLYTTSDTGFAAYLVSRGFILLGAIDTGIDRKAFGFTSTDEMVLDKLAYCIEQAYYEFDNVFYTPPQDGALITDVRLNFRQYYQDLRQVKSTLSKPVRREL